MWPLSFIVACQHVLLNQNFNLKYIDTSAGCISIKLIQNYSVIQQTTGKKRGSVLIIDSRTPQVNNKHITIEKCI